MIFDDDVDTIVELIKKGTIKKFGLYIVRNWSFYVC